MKAKQPIVLFDGQCSLCSFFVRLILKYEKEPKLYFSSLDSDYVKYVLSDLNCNLKGLNTVVFINNDEVYLKSLAVFKVVTYLRFPLSIVQYFRLLPLAFSDFVYDLVAKYRIRLFGKVKSCYIPDDTNRNRFFH